MSTSLKNQLYGRIRWPASHRRSVLWHLRLNSACRVRLAQGIRGRIIQEQKKRHLILLNWFNKLYKHHKINQTLKSMFMSFSIKELPKNEVRLRSNWLLLHCFFFTSLFFSDTICSSRILVKSPHRSQHMGGHVGVNPIEATILIAPLISPKNTHTKKTLLMNMYSINNMCCVRSEQQYLYSRLIWSILKTLGWIGIL